MKVEGQGRALYNQCEGNLQQPPGLKPIAFAGYEVLFKFLLGRLEKGEGSC